MTVTGYQIFWLNGYVLIVLTAANGAVEVKKIDIPVYFIDGIIEAIRTLQKENESPQGD